RSVLTTLVATGVYGVVVGSLVARFPTLLKANPGFERIIEHLGGTRVLADAFTTYMVQIGAIALGAWACALVLRALTEENHGRVTLLVASGASRGGVLDGMTVTALGAGVCGTVLWGVGIGAGRAIGDHHVDSLGAGALAGLVAVPALLVVVAFAVACVGVSRRLAWCVWLAIGWCGAVAILRTYLGLPGLVLDVSPFWHQPSVPLRGEWWEPTCALAAVAVVLGSIGRSAYRRRELGAAG
ncbi:MAG TPA: hypothetical protein VMD28_09035, partial [Acidimicrobiales bacterium]|nr:hypothetical protein [Acidimicrobiales bacterium]